MHKGNFIRKELKYAILTDVASKYWCYAISYVDPDNADDNIADIIEQYSMIDYRNTSFVRKIIQKKDHEFLFKELKIHNGIFAEPKRCYAVPLSINEYEACKIFLGVALKSDIIEYVQKYKTCLKK